MKKNNFGKEPIVSLPKNYEIYFGTNNFEIVNIEFDFDQISNDKSFIENFQRKQIT